MSQSVVIFGVILFLFLVYVTSKGQLPKYLGILGVNSATPAAGTPGGQKLVGPLTFGQPQGTISAADMLANSADLAGLIPTLPAIGG